MDFTKIDLTLFFFSILPGVITGVLGTIATYFNLRQKFQQIAIQPKLDEADLAAKVEAIYAKLDAVREKEIASLRQQVNDGLAQIDLLHKQAADVQIQLQDERTEHRCEMQLMREGYELRIGQMQMRITELESEIAKLKNGAAVK